MSYKLKVWLYLLWPHLGQSRPLERSRRRVRRPLSHPSNCPPPSPPPVPLKPGSPGRCSVEGLRAHPGSWAGTVDLQKEGSLNVVWMPNSVNLYEADIWGVFTHRDSETCSGPFVEPTRDHVNIFDEKLITVSCCCRPILIHVVILDLYARDRMVLRVT